MAGSKEILIAGTAVAIASYLLTKDIKTTLIISAVHGTAHWMTHRYADNTDEHENNATYRHIATDIFHNVMPHKPDNSLCKQC